MLVMNLQGKKQKQTQQKEGEGKVPVAEFLHAKIQQKPTITGFGFMWIQAGQELDQNIRG